MSDQAEDFQSEESPENSSEELGRTLFERIPRGRRPAWARQLLLLVTERAKYIPPEIEAVLQIAATRRDWPKAHDAFSAVRRLVLDQEHRGYPESERLQLRILSLAELVAKITYNASGEPRPFDKGTGWSIARALQAVCSLLNDAEFTDRIWEQLNTAGVMRDSSAR